MKIRRLLGVICLLAWAYGLATKQSWARDWWLPFLGFSLLGSKDKAREAEGIPAVHGAQSTYQAQPVYEYEEQEVASDEQAVAYTPLMSDADYTRIARFLEQRLPFLSQQQLHEPSLRRYIEEHILSGGKLGELEQAFGGAVQARTTQPRTLESGTQPADRRLREARARNQAQIEALHAAIPVSRTGTTFAFLALERARRHHKPRAQVVPQGLRAGSQQRRLRLKPSPIHREIAQSRRTMLHSGLQELQALRAPSAKITRDGRLTGASTELRSLPPRYVR